MRLLCLATSVYADPHAREWHPELRHTVGYLRSQGLNAEFRYVPVPRGSQVAEDGGSGARASGPEAIFLELTEESRTQQLRLLQEVREASPRTRLLVGGVPATLGGDALLRDHPWLDYLIVGEREHTLAEVLRLLEAGRDPAGVPGLHSRHSRGPARPLLADLDALGHMVHDGIESLLPHDDGGEKVGYVAGSRGCYAHCSFCSVPDFYRVSPGKRWRGRSPHFIVEELEALLVKFGITRFVFQDDNFIGPGEAGQTRAVALARLILDRRLPIQYSACCRINDLRPATLEALMQSGLSALGMSVESCCPESLHLLQKGISPAQIEASLRLVEQLRLPCQINLIFFDPYTTLEGVRGNLDLLERLRGSDTLSYTDSFPFNELVAFPWSRVARRLRAQGLLDPSGQACQYRDPAVARLVAFTRRLRDRVPVTFKRRVVLDALADRGGQAIEPRAMQALLRLSQSVRTWIGLALMPRYVRAACDLLTANTDGLDDSLRRLEEEFAEEVEPLRHPGKTRPVHSGSPEANEEESRLP